MQVQKQQIGIGVDGERSPYLSKMPCLIFFIFKQTIAGQLKANFKFELFVYQLISRYQRIIGRMKSIHHDQVDQVEAESFFIVCSCSKNKVGFV